MCAAAEVSLYLEFVARAMLSGVALYFVLFMLIVYCQRARWRRSQRGDQRRRRKRIRFYPTTMMIGLALQTLQVFAPEPQAPGAEVMAVKAVTYCFSDTIGVTGFLLPREEAIVNLDADGYRISETLVKEGATVTSGQELVRLTRLNAEGQNVPAPPGARPGPATMVLKAPAAGLVTRSTATVGAVASLRAEPLYRIMINAEIELEVEVPSIQLPKLRADGRQAARVEVENGTEVTGRTEEPELATADLLVEEVSIDGMCGVY